MDKMIYIKYNSLRKPEYRVSTEIRENDDGMRSVVKRPMNRASAAQINTIKSNFTKLSGLYRNVGIIPFTENGDVLVFPFIFGRPLAADIDLQHMSTDEIYGRIDEALKIIYDFREDAGNFVITDRFKSAFPGLVPGENEPAYSVTNIDSNIDNFLVSEGKVWCIDYEWVFDFPVPVRYVRFRTLLYYYAKQNAFIADRISADEFYSHFGYTNEDVRLFTEMEDCFQQYVHGTDRRYIVTSHYEKTHRSFAEISELATKLPEEIRLKDAHIGNLNEIISSDKELLTEKDSRIGNLNEIIHTDEEAITSLRGDVDMLNNTVSECNSTISKLNSDIWELNSTAFSLKSKVRRQQELLDCDRRTIESKDNHIGNLEAIISNREDIISIREEQLSQRDAYISEIMHAKKNPFYGMYLVCRKIKNRIVPAAGDKTAKQNSESAAGDAADNQSGMNVKTENCTAGGSEAPSIAVNDYEEWITKIESGQTYDDKFDYMPTISVIVPVYNVLDKHLVPCIESVLNQIYPNFELCMADDCSTWDNVRATLKRYEDNPKVKIVYRKENGHISRSTNSAMELATGEFVAFLDCDDTLSPNALYEVVKELNRNNKLDFIYSDEDKTDDDGKNRHSPFFKPDWSPDTLMSLMYTCHLGVYRTSIAREIGGLRTGFEGSQDYDFVLRFTENLARDHIAHIPKILYHWLERKESTSVNPESKPYILEAALKAKQEAVERRGLTANIELIREQYQYRVDYVSRTNSKVSIIMPSKDNPEVIRRCIESVRYLTRYRNYEIIVVDNGSSDENRALYQKLVSEANGKYIYFPEQFNFSHMCNLGAANSEGEYYLFLNDDTEVLDGKWLGRMLGQAELAHTGAVGVKLIYPQNNLIQHCGVINTGTGPVHAFGMMSDEPSYYYGRNKLTYNYLAVTAACLMVSRAKFEEIGGFNENLAVAYNDMDFCFKLAEAGYYNVVRNDVVLYHYESLSRGDDRADEAKMIRLGKEREHLYSIHPDYYYTDPYYNENLNQYANDFSINFLKLTENVCRIEAASQEYEESDEVCGYLDSVYNNRRIFIQGWGFLKGHCGSVPAKILFSGGSISYVISTEAMPRPDLAVPFAQEQGVASSGFRALIDKSKLNPGTYSLSIVCGDLRVDAKRTVEI